MRRAASGHIQTASVRSLTGPETRRQALETRLCILPLILRKKRVQPGKTLDQYGQLKLGARISRSGQPIGQSGDLESDPVVVSTLSNAEISLAISKRRP